MLLASEQVHPYLPVLVEACYAHPALEEYNVIGHVLPLAVFHALTLVMLEAVLVRSATQEDVLKALEVAISAFDDAPELTEFEVREFFSHWCVGLY